ncbi:MAG: hypothetical protein O3C01_00520 [Bacteroidetes bacterium]|nr:hypothetical protein [Bacteroidota bacterium]MDA1019781.1 hypothetical protein [Bacteroidota bacterium]|tara:strand:+ start:95731 stop:96558 length:828 start_codon:yes stop_codon:yes gene_type:complete
MTNFIPNPSNFLNTENTNKIILFYFFKFSKFSNSSEFLISISNNKINCLHWFNCQYTNIGKEDFWTNAAIIEFENKEILEKAFNNKLEFNTIKALQVFMVLPKNPSRLLLNFLKLFRPVGYLFKLFKNSSIEELIENNNSEILPSKKQTERLLNETSNKKAYMINLLEARETAKYSDLSIVISGKEAYYKKYGNIASRSVLLMGGDITYVGRFNGEPLIEFNVPNDTKGNWQALGIMEYPLARNMLDLEKMPGYKEALKHRDAGLKKTFNLYSTK